MKLKMTHLLFGVPVVLITMLKGEDVRNSVQQSSLISQEQMTTSSQSRILREEAKNARKFSKVAIERLKSNCIQTVDATTRKDDYYQPGAIVLDNNLKRPIRDGAFVCNSLGDTAVIQNGSIVDIARVSLVDKNEYDSLFKRGATNNGKSSKR